ncbi:hypothetical protein CVT25_003756 [Psilocybe cyanescens]|uniref:Uncharacterized protein n=1 Tax=Psilocybe cyanescens TaxID=93625 RepID=A0A409XTZ9_PSICY|nr:hypothetical protein CVT25_003756 [Psilocybe cyanescens]
MGQLDSLMNVPRSTPPGLVSIYHVRLLRLRQSPYHLLHLFSRHPPHSHPDPHLPIPLLPTTSYSGPAPISSHASALISAAKAPFPVSLVQDPQVWLADMQSNISRYLESEARADGGGMKE